MNRTRRPPRSLTASSASSRPFMSPGITTSVSNRSSTSLFCRIAKAALAILQNKDVLDLLLTDVVMPGDMNGRELADEAVRLRGGLRVLFMTGYSRDAIIRHGRIDPGVHMIGKPFSFDDLAAKVRGRLDAAE